MVKLAACAMALVTAIPAITVAAEWPGETMPLPLAAKTPEELSLKTEAERLYLTFNLLAGGKTAYDAGDYERAVRKWEALLRLDHLPARIVDVVTPLLKEARTRSGAPAPRAAERAPALPEPTPVAAAAAPIPRTTVSGTVQGGGAIGPAGAVLWLRRTDGSTPSPRPRRRVISQRDKKFSPRVLAVPVGSEVEMRNEDDFFHNVFSLGPTKSFDTGLYAGGKSSVQRFDKAGPVEILCNIHETMMGYVYVVDSPWYAQPTATGSFTIRGVTPGRYDLYAWHELATGTSRRSIIVGADGVGGITVDVAADRAPLTHVPDKYGKPRHLQLGY